MWGLNFVGRNKMNNIELIQEHCYAKRLNFLIGSGASSDAIPLMGHFSSFGDKANEELLKCVKDISEKTLLRCKGEKAKRPIKLKEMLNIFITSNVYTKFIDGLVQCLLNVNSRTIPRSVNIFTTNYDLFLECAIDRVLRTQNFVCNDGSRGYFTKVLDWTNFNRVVAYKGINDNYNYELPLVNLIKPHGSVNWKREEESVLITPNVCEAPFVVPPTGDESRETFLTNYFYEMLRVFQLELEKPQSVLIVIGFSFQDSHIAKMVRRAIQNPELRVYIFAYSNNAINSIRKNLGISEMDSRLIIWGPDDFESKPLTLKEVTQILFEKK
jgi:hypothetical protein